MDKRTLKDHTDIYVAPEKSHVPRHVNIIADALYFGERKEETSWCVVVLRDPKRKENLWWDFVHTETTGVYLRGKQSLEEKGYTIRSVTGDGFAGIRHAFAGIPFQMCHVHMERLVIRGTTRKPQLEAGKVLFALIRTIHYTDEATFRRYFEKYIEKYREFLNEKTINEFTGGTFFTHEPLRAAVLSLARFLPYLFTFAAHKDISKTSNSLEGHFAHIRDVVEVHRGLPRKQKERILHSILLASTVAPTAGKLRHVL